MNKKSFYFKIVYMKDTNYMDSSMHTPYDIEITAWDRNGAQVDKHLTEEFPELLKLFDHLNYEEICEGTIMIYNVSNTVTTNEIADLLQNAKFKVDYIKRKSREFIDKDRTPFDRKEFEKFIELKTYGGDYMAAPKNIIENPEDLWQWILTEIKLLKQQIKGET